MTTPFPNFSYYPTNVNLYVRAAQMDSRVSPNGHYAISFGTPSAANTTAILSAQSVASAVTVEYTSMLSYIADAPFGRDVTFVASGADTDNVTIIGYDYLGQKVKKTKALTGTTSMSIGVAFKRIESIEFAAEAGITVNVGWGAALGLPFKTVAVLAEQLDGVGVAADSPGTLTLPVLTDPATASTGDPRGLFTPASTLNGAKELVIQAVADRWVNSSGNGGLFGISHYGG